MYFYNENILFSAYPAEGAGRLIRALTTQSIAFVSRAQERSSGEAHKAAHRDRGTINVPLKFLNLAYFLSARFL